MHIAELQKLEDIQTRTCANLFKICAKFCAYFIRSWLLISYLVKTVYTKLYPSEISVSPMSNKPALRTLYNLEVIFTMRTTPTTAINTWYVFKEY